MNVYVAFIIKTLIVIVHVSDFTQEFALHGVTIQYHKLVLQLLNDQLNRALKISRKPKDTS